MATELTLFHFDDGRASFEDLAKKNGTTHWGEDELRQALGYATQESFANVIRKAKQACLTLGIATEDHFVRDADGHRLTRFACYLIAMNGDPKKPNVAAAQVYFAALAETFQSHLEHANALDRVMIRDEITDGHKALSSTAKSHGVENYAFFLNKGYMGMYNMSLDQLTAYKGVPKGEVLVDRMDKPELAAHLFRITQTEMRISTKGIRGQRQLETAAEDVGKAVRKTMIENSTPPEELPIAPHIRDMKKQLKGTNKKLSLVDKRKKK